MGRRLVALALAGVASTLAVHAAAGIDHKKVPPRGVVEDCSTRSEADFPGAFANRYRNLIVGPFVLTGAGGSPAWASSFHGNKFPLLVKNGHRVTLELSRRTRRFAGLAYGPLPQGETHLRDTHRVVTFVACRASEDSGSTADKKLVTF